jgi:hypothetical protein
MLSERDLRAMNAPLATIGAVIYEGELTMPSVEPRISR